MSRVNLDIPRQNAARATAIMATLALNGVQHAVVSPGSRSTPLALAAGPAGIVVHVVLDERAAGFIALGLARASGAPVVLVCTSGTAGAHYLPALIEASLSRVGLIAITANRPGRLQNVGAPQTIDQVGLFGRFVRECLVVGVDSLAGHARALTARSVALASGTLRGPVHLDVAFDEPLWDPSVEPVADPGLRVVQGDPSSSVASAPAALVAELCEARRGLFVAGPHTPADAIPALIALAEHLGWPLLADGASGARFGTRSDRVVTTAEALLRDPTLEGRLAPDLIVRVGHSPTTRVVGEWLARQTQARTVLIDAGARMHDPSSVASMLVDAVPGPVLLGLAVSLPDRRLDEWAHLWSSVETAARSEIDRSAREGFWEGTIVQELLNYLPDSAALCVASSMPVRDLDLVAGTRERSLTVFVSRGANGIDGTISTAAGVALADRTRPTVALLGDLAFRHDISGLLAARGLGAPLTLVVIDNGGGGIFEFLPISQHPQFNTLFLTPQDTDIADLCRGAGVSVVEVTSRIELVRALEQAPAHSLRVVLARVDREDNVRRYRGALSSAASAAVGVCPEITYAFSAAMRPDRKDPTPRHTGGIPGGWRRGERGVARAEQRQVLFGQTPRAAFPDGDPS